MASLSDLIHGSKPEVAPYVPTHYPQEQLNTILANISAFPNIAELGDLYQQYMTSSFEAAGLPITKILQSGGVVTREMLDQAQQELMGKVPQDVQDQIRRQDALTSMLSGGPGGASALTARDLGLTSLNLINQGANLAGQAGNALQRWTGTAQGLIMNPAGMMFTPQQQVQQEEFNRIMHQTTLQTKYNIDAAPDPATVDRVNLAMGILGMATGAGGMGGGLHATGAYGSLFGGGGGGFGGAGAGSSWGGSQPMNFGGVNQYAATTGGFNFGGSNFGGQNIPYMGGQSDVTTPGYYMGGG